MVTGDGHRGQDVDHHEDPLDQGEAGGEDQGGQHGSQAEGEVMKGSKIFVLF